MLLQITHSTNYCFTDKVFLEPHYFRFRPKSNKTVHVSSYQIEISPTPIGLNEYLDAENNHIQFCWFNQPTDKLNITTTSIIESTPFNPFDFIIYPDNYLTLPFIYDNEIKNLLSIYLIHENLSDELLQFGKQSMHETHGQIIDFISIVIRNTFSEFEKEKRHKGDPHHPNDTFKTQKGSCRDLAWMLIHLFRSMGIASRFVSGYYFIHNPTEGFELHAWIEIFIPGVGWIGIDPSEGIFVNENYIALASSSAYPNTMTVSGTYRGGLAAKLNNSINIVRL